MKKIRYILFLALGGLLTISCSEDHNCEEGVIQTPNAIAPIDGGDYNASLLDCRIERTQNFVIQAFQGGQIFGAQGGFINIPPQSIFDINGQIIDGAVDVRLIEMYTRGEAITCQLSTNTLNATGNIEPSLSEGLLFFDITFNGDPVIIEAEIQVFIPEENNNQELLLFDSPTCPDLDCLVTWEQSIDSQVFPSEIDNPDGTLSFGYTTFVFEGGWFSFAQFNPDQNSRTLVYDKAPNGYNAGNSNVFLQYDNAKIAVSLFAQYETALDVFSETYGEIPIGTTGQLIFISRQDGNYQYATNPVTVSQDIIGVTTDISIGNEAQLIEVINAL